MYGATTIDSVETTMTSSRDETIHGLTFNVNKKILFAPLEVAISFPNLAGYSLYSCSIKTVAKRHFKDLVKLRALWLARNQIKEIASDTFDDLVSLEFLNLSKFDYNLLFSDSDFDPIRWQQNKIIERWTVFGIEPFDKRWTE